MVLLMAETESDYRNHASVTSIDSGHDIANTSINTLSPLPPLHFRPGWFGVVVISNVMMR